MTLSFSIDYTTSYKEELQLNVVVTDDDGTRKTASFDMTTDDGQRWSCRINNISTQNNPHIDYYFSVANAGRETRREWTGVTHRIDLCNLSHCDTVRVENRWHDVPDDAFLYSTPFTDCINRRQTKPLPTSAYRRTLRLTVRAPQLRTGERLAIVADRNANAEWTAIRPIMMHEHNTGEWQADFNAANLYFPFHYKFVAVGKDGDRLEETGSCRYIEIPAIGEGETVALEMEQANFDIQRPQPKASTVTVAALRSDNSFGIGDIGDTTALIDNSTDSNLILLHPLYDTISTHTDADANPYSIISVYAIHPIYADLHQLPPIADPQEAEQMETLRKELNATPHPDYQRTLTAKLRYLNTIFVQEADHIMRQTAFRRFFDENERWLVPYAQYSYLRDAYGIADFRQWPNHKEWTEAERGQLANPRTKAYKKLAIYYYVQFVLHRQLAEMHRHAREKGIVVAADMTANINPNGCDIWQEASAVDSDTWWQLRLKSAAKYTDACLTTNATANRRNVVESSRLWITADKTVFGKDIRSLSTHQR